MYILYTDESGDPGIKAGSSDKFIISGLIIPSKNWRTIIDRYKKFRRNVRDNYKIPVKNELHGVDMVGSRGKVGGVEMKLKQRRSLFSLCINFLSSQDDLELKIYYVIMEKKSDKFKINQNKIQNKSFEFLFQRFSNFLKKKNEKIIESRNKILKPNTDENKNIEIENFKNLMTPNYGIIFSDETNINVLKSVIRKMRVYNPVPSQPWASRGSRNLKDEFIIEDPSLKKSNESAFIQMADWAVTALKCQEMPSKYQKDHKLEECLLRLKNVALKEASNDDRSGLGIVRYPRKC